MMRTNAASASVGRVTHEERTRDLRTRVRKRSRAKVNDTRRCEHTLQPGRKFYNFFPQWLPESKQFRETMSHYF